QGLAPDGAAAGAAAAMLIALFPKEESDITQRINQEATAIGTSARADFAKGIEVGRAAAGDVVAAAKSDRSNLAWTGTVPEGTGRWTSLSKPVAAPLGPRLGEMRPFFL